MASGRMILVFLVLGSVGQHTHGLFMINSVSKSKSSPNMPALFKFLPGSCLQITHWLKNSPEITLIKENKTVLKHRNSKANTGSRNKEIYTMSLGKESKKS